LLPWTSGGAVKAESGPMTSIYDILVDAIILAIDDNGTVIDEVDGVMMDF